MEKTQPATAEEIETWKERASRHDEDHRWFAILFHDSFNKLIATIDALTARAERAEGELDADPWSWCARMRKYEAERDTLKAAVFGSRDYDPKLPIGNFVEMVRSTEAARQGALQRAEAAEADAAALRQRVEALEGVLRPFKESWEVAAKLVRHGSLGDYEAMTTRHLPGGSVQRAAFALTQEPTP